MKRRWPIAIGVLLLAIFGVWLVLLSTSAGPPPLQVSEVEAEQVARGAWIALSDESRTPIERAQLLASLYDYRDAISQLQYEAVEGDEWKVSLNGTAVVGTMDRADPEWCADCFNETFEALHQISMCDALRAYMVLDALAGGVASSVVEDNQWIVAAALRGHILRELEHAASEGNCDAGVRGARKLVEWHKDQALRPWERQLLPKRLIPDSLVDACCE
ncbi:MAG: hypothetical protein KDA20_04365 [Phycisphaerales bacterium]|nr:hypothetical protein [Phycisphaerales bacterium]